MAAIAFTGALGLKDARGYHGAAGTGARERTTAPILVAIARITIPPVTISQNCVDGKVGDGVRKFPTAHTMNAPAHRAASFRVGAFATNSVNSHIVETRRNDPPMLRRGLLPGASTPARQWRRQGSRQSGRP